MKMVGFMFAVESTDHTDPSTTGTDPWLIHQRLQSWKYQLIIRYSLLSELPVIIWQQAHDIRQVLTEYLTHQLGTPLVKTWQLMVWDIPSALRERINGPPLETLAPNRLLDYYGKPNTIPKQGSVITRLPNNFTRESEDDFLIYGLPETCIADPFSNMTPQEVADWRYNRPKQPFRPRETWSLPFALTIATARALMLNELSLNAARALTDFTYCFTPRSISILALPRTKGELMRMFHGIGLVGIKRQPQLKPDEFTESDFRFQRPKTSSGNNESPNPLRMAVNPHCLTDQELIGGEWVSCQRARQQDSVYMTSIYGSDIVHAAEEFMECVNRVKVNDETWFRDWIRQCQMYSDQLSAPSNILARWMRHQTGLNKERLDLISAYLKLRNLQDVYLNRPPAQRPHQQRQQPSKVILYLHGGGYSLMSPRAHRAITWRIAQETGCRVCAIEYRRAPEFRFPASLIDAVSAYMYLINDDHVTPSSDLFDSAFPHPAVLCGQVRQLPIRPQDIIIMGDSAGGGLSLSLLLHLRDLQLPMPACACLLSPWLDLTKSTPSWNRNNPHDYIPRMDPRTMDNVMSAYVGWNDDLLRHPLVSPVYGDMEGLPPLLVQVGEVEYLFDEVMVLAHKFQYSGGVDGGMMRLEVYQDMVHVWHFFEGTRMATLAYERISDFIALCTRSRCYIDDLDSLDIFCGSRRATVVGFDSAVIDQSEEDAFIKLKKHTSVDAECRINKIYVTAQGEYLPIVGNLSLCGRFQREPPKMHMT